jgi:hypothetical protein
MTYSKNLQWRLARVWERTAATMKKIRAGVELYLKARQVQRLGSMPALSGF